MSSFASVEQENREDNITKLSKIIQRFLLEASCNAITTRCINVGFYEENDDEDEENDDEDEEKYNFNKKSNIYELALEVGSVDEAIRILSTNLLNNNKIILLFNELKDFIKNCKKNNVILSLKNIENKKIGNNNYIDHYYHNHYYIDLKNNDAYDYDYDYDLEDEMLNKILKKIINYIGIYEIKNFLYREGFHYMLLDFIRNSEF